MAVWRRTPRRPSTASRREFSGIHRAAFAAGYQLHCGFPSGELTRRITVGDVNSFVMAEDHIRDVETYFVAAQSYKAFGTESIGASTEVTATARAPIVLGIVPDRGPTGGFTR